MSNKRILSFATGVLLLSSCVPALAQTTGSARPFQRALFGSQETVNSPQRLDASALLLEAYDDNLFATLGGNVDPRSRPVSGVYTMLLPGFDYRLAHPRFQLGVTGASAFGYYSDINEVRTISHNFGAGFSAKTGRRTTILLNQTAAYSPSYLYGLFPKGAEVSPGDPMPDSPNYALADVESYSYGTTGTVSFGLSRRTSASVGGNYRYTDFTHETPVQRDLSSEGFDGVLSYQRSRNLAIRTSYHYATGSLGYGGQVDTNENRLEAGFLYSRPLSATRQMNLSVSLGGSAVDSTGALPGLQLPDRLYRVSADASLEYPFARSWTMNGALRRGLEFVPGLAQPVYATGVRAGLDGLVSRRIQIGGGGGYSQGRSALAPGASQYDTYNGSAYLQYALTRSSALQVEYLYYFYDFVGDVLVISGGPQRMQRNGIRIGLRLLVPALRG